MEFNEKIIDQFKAYIEYFNISNDVKLNFEDAVHNRAILKSFIDSIKQNNTLKEKLDFEGVQMKSKNKTTKFKSYTLLNIPELDKQVLDYVTKFPSQTREDIALGTGRKVSTICGAINRLVKNKMVFISGRIKDLNTNREVEVISSLIL